MRVALSATAIGSAVGRAGTSCLTSAPIYILVRGGWTGGSRRTRARTARVLLRFVSRTFCRRAFPGRSVRRGLGGRGGRLSEGGRTLGVWISIRVAAERISARGRRGRRRPAPNAGLAASCPSARATGVPCLCLDDGIRCGQDAGC
jgi:hypothetical protein